MEIDWQDFRFTALTPYPRSLRRSQPQGEGRNEKQKAGA
jgi:hypothetical protein